MALRKQMLSTVRTRASKARALVFGLLGEPKTRRRRPDSPTGGVWPESGPAPVVVYHRNRAPGEVQKIVDCLEAAAIPHQVLDLEGDEASLEAVERESQGFRLPVVFVAGTPIGGSKQLELMANRGQLRPLVFQE